MLTLVPLFVILYYFEIPGVFNALSTPSEAALFVTSLTLATLWVILKRPIIPASIELSSPSFTGGTALLAGSVVLLLYGSYNSPSVWYHYESMVFFVSAYVVLRVGWRAFRVFAPAVIMLGYGFLPEASTSAIPAGVIPALASVVFVLIFLWPLERRLLGLLLPIAVVYLGLVSWRFPTVTLAGNAFPVWSLVPVPLLALGIPKARKLTLPSRPDLYSCKVHGATSEGFCPDCGRRIGRIQSAGGFEVWGLIEVITVTFILVFASVPVLYVQGGAAYDASFSPGGMATQAAPAAPSGWQVNTTTSYHDASGEVSAVERVFVPLVHPETANYTEYFVLSTNLAFTAAPAGDLPGWVRDFNEFLPLGPIQGYLTAYVQPGNVMMVYQGMSRVKIYNGTGFQNLFLTTGFVRDFKNANVTNDASIFQADVSGTWIPTLQNTFLESSWGGFMSSTLAVLENILPFLEVVASISILGWIGYRVVKYDSSIDRFLKGAANTDPDSWPYLKTLITRKGHAATEHEISASLTQVPTRGVVETRLHLEDLKERRLVHQSVVESQGDTLLVWKANL